MRKGKGFTLIELLIVVAIIAILAAIAIPNFLRAQVRARVARVEGELRNYATGLESYNVEMSKYPLDTDTPPKYMDGPVGGDIYYGVVDAMAHALTSPISYFTSFAKDPFRVKRGDPDAVRGYLYATNSMTFWVAWSVGPDGVGQFIFDDEIPPLAQAEDTFSSESNFSNSQRRWTLITLSTKTYDASNGTLSTGDVWRAGP